MWNIEYTIWDLIPRQVFLLEQVPDIIRIHFMDFTRLTWHSENQSQFLSILQQGRNRRAAQALSLPSWLLQCPATDRTLADWTSTLSTGLWESILTASCQWDRFIGAIEVTSEIHHVWGRVIMSVPGGHGNRVLLGSPTGGVKVRVVVTGGLNVRVVVTGGVKVRVVLTGGGQGQGCPDWRGSRSGLSWLEGVKVRVVLTAGQVQQLTENKEGSK